MKLIIDIPTDHYNEIVFQDVDKLRECVKNGTVVENVAGVDCVNREALKERFRWLEKATKYGNEDAEQQHFSYSTMMMYEIKDEIDNVIDSLPSVQPQSLEQIKWERDTAIEQLKQLGYGLGEKVEPCEDCVSRKELLSRIDAERRHLLDVGMDGAEHIIVHHARRIIEDMPAVTPQPYRESEENADASN